MLAAPAGSTATNRTTLRLLIDFGLGETREISQRILPAEIARFHRNGVGKTLLHDFQLSAAGYWLERHRHLDFARQIGIVEFVRVAQALAGAPDIDRQTNDSCPW